MNKEQYETLKKAFIGLKKTHETAQNGGIYDFKALNYYADIIEKFHVLKEFDTIQNHILSEIGGL
jgi:adenine specific DNA methylase Mod